MNRLVKKLCLAAAILVSALTFSANAAQAQSIYPIEGGRTTVTFTDGFLSELGSLKVTPAAVYGSQLYGSKIFFPITSGAVSLDSARGQIVHSGGIALTAGSTEVRAESFIISILDDKAAFITALVVANGRFAGRIKLFDIELPSDITLPLDPKDGDFFLSDVKVKLSTEGAAALNDAFNVTGFNGGQVVGNSLSLVFTPLSADGH